MSAKLHKNTKYIHGCELNYELWKREDDKTEGNS